MDLRYPMQFSHQLKLTYFSNKKRATAPSQSLPSIFLFSLVSFVYQNINLKKHRQITIKLIPSSPVR